MLYNDIAQFLQVQLGVEKFDIYFSISITI